MSTKETRNYVSVRVAIMQLLYGQYSDNSVSARVWYLFETWRLLEVLRYVACSVWCWFLVCVIMLSVMDV